MAAANTGKAGGVSPGEVLGGTLRIVRPLGHGGMGTVFEAHHTRLGGRFAVKLLRGARAESPGALEAFEREARIVSRLNHPHIVNVFDFRSAPGEPAFLAMELVDGCNLSELLAEEPALPLARVVRLAGQIASAVQAAHDRGIVHCDLKPSNVLVLRPAPPAEEHVKIVDFGVSRMLAEAAGDGEGDAGVRGTPRYMAPEQIRQPSAPPNPRSDQYALAALVYELLTGAPAVGAGDEHEVMFEVLHGSPIPPSRLRPDLPAAVEQVLAMALSKDPDRRFATVAAFAEALQGAAERGKPQALPQANPGRAAKVAVRGVVLLGMAELVARCWMLGVGAGLAAAAQDPAQTVFQLLILPLAIAVLSRRFPSELVRVALARHRALALGAAALLGCVSILYALNDLREAVCDRLTPAEDVRDPVLRQELQALRTSAHANRSDPTLARHLRETYEGRLDAGRRGGCRYFALASPRAMLAGAGTIAGLSFATLMLYLFFLQALVGRVAQNHRQTFLLVFALMVAWLPLRAYSQWHANLGTLSVSIYTPFALALVASAVSGALLFARRGRGRLLGVAAASAILSVGAVMLWLLAPGALEPLAQGFSGLSAIHAAALYTVLGIAVMGGFLSLLPDAALAFGPWLTRTMTTQTPSVGDNDTNTPGKDSVAGS